MQEEYTDDSYTLDIPCITSDEESLTIELIVTLLDKGIRPRKLYMTRTWLDNYYRPMLMKKIEMHIFKYTKAQVKAKGDEIIQEMQLIANNLFSDIIPPQ